MVHNTNYANPLFGKTPAFWTGLLKNLLLHYILVIEGGFVLAVLTRCTGVLDWTIGVGELLFVCWQWHQLCPDCGRHS